MRYGVIDIGTNTIRGVVFEENETGLVKCEDKLVRSHLIKENVRGRLTEAGINRLIVVINKLAQVFREAKCDKTGCFATAAMRELENRGEVADMVLKATGIEIHVLSGKEEAEYGMVALRLSIAERSAAGIDLGGGSCQLMQFEGDRLLCAESYNIGSYKMKMNYVKGFLPDSEERKRIEFAVHNETAGVRNLFGVRYLYAMGGTAKSALKLYSVLTNADCSDKFLSTEMLDRLCRLGDREPEKMYEVYTRILKNNAELVIPGAVVLKTMCDFFSAAGVYVQKCGVREGYLIKELRSKGGN